VSRIICPNRLPLTYSSSGRNNGVRERLREGKLGITIGEIEYSDSIDGDEAKRGLCNTGMLAAALAVPMGMSGSV